MDIRELATKLAKEKIQARIDDERQNFPPVKDRKFVVDATADTIVDRAIAHGRSESG